MSITRYRKIHDMDFDFTPGINIISGTNGTCKTSLLHIISNSFRGLNKNCDWVQDSKCLETIRGINNAFNPKIETLVKGDKVYNDPANGYKGNLFNVVYINDFPLDFRKHNSVKNHRYAVKQKYASGTNEKLPYCPVIYLGLSRLFPYGEFQNEAAVKKINKSLPSKYHEEIARLYESFTHINISSSAAQNMGDIKIRHDFVTDKLGIDSNTISAGEDNLLMLLTAVVSLRYYYESIESTNEVESVLLVDEFDATLHPSYQFKLLQLFREYAHNYKIQIVFTTHSLSLLEVALKNKDNVFYLRDDITDVQKMDDPDIYKIKMYLYNQTHDDIYTGRFIPIFSEDEEARIFLKILFDYYSDKSDDFTRIRRFWYLVDAKLGSENLKSIFNNTYLIKSTLRSICILDGDQKRSHNLENHIIVLPSNLSPEKLIMDYSIQLYEADDPFWRNDIILDLNYTKMSYLDNIKPDIDSIANKIQELRENSQSTKGVERELRKTIFGKHQRFFELLFKHWINDPENKREVEKFFEDLYIMFRKVAEYHNINKKDWNSNVLDN